MNKDLLPVEEEDSFIAELTNLICESSSNPNFKVATVYKKSGKSKSCLYRLLARKESPSFSRIRQNIRISRAEELLTTTQMHIVDIAFEVGFRDPNYFSRVFSHEIGCPPSIFRQKNKNHEK